MPRSHNASSRAKPSWRRFESKFKILSNRFRRTGILFVISAPSGAGKTTLVDALRQTSEFIYSVSCTTRSPRAGEVEGQDYRFLSEAEFTNRLKAGDFLEHATVHGHHYGTLLKPNVEDLKNGQDVLIDIDTQGAASIRKSKDDFVRLALSDIFIMPPDLEELRRRLTKRGTETTEQIESRLTTAAREMRAWREYRYTIISRTTDEDLQKFRHIMNAERYLSRRLIQS